MYAEVSTVRHVSRLPQGDGLLLRVDHLHLVWSSIHQLVSSQCSLAKEKDVKFKLYVRDKQAFVDIGNSYLLCVGTVKQVEEATGEELLKMIDDAKAWSKFRNLTPSNQTLH